MTDCPFFSVIVPTHKRAGLLHRALQSIRAQVVEALFEVIVIADVTDPETDAVCAAVLTPADTYVRRSGKPGPSASRNLALSLAKGAYVLFLDDDDAWHPNCLAQLLDQEPVRRGQTVYFNCSVVTERRPAGIPEFISEAEVNLNGLLTPDVYVKNQVHMSCFAFPKHVLAGIGFDPFMYAYEDWEFMLSVCDRGMPVHVPLLGSRIFEVKDDTTDRRGDSAGANGFHAVLDYLYAYHRHPAPTPEIQAKRAQLMRTCGIGVPPELM
jgi:GalNAc5-diNAcBac-PP-undecaprenol beta-1,3-glucosyltransferase